MQEGEGVRVGVGVNEGEVLGDVERDDVTEGVTETEGTTYTSHAL